MGDEMRWIIPTLTQQRSQARERMLNGLSSDHLRILSQLIGRLAVAVTPDFDAAARELDKALSSDEKQCIAHAAADLDAQASRAIEDLRQKLMRSGKNVAFGADDSRTMMRENPGMTLLVLVIEQLVSQVNREKLGRNPQ